MWSFLLLILNVIANVDSLWLTKNRPGALPVLAKLRNKDTGNLNYNLAGPESYEDLEHLVLLALDYVQDADKGNVSNKDVKMYKMHKLVDIKEANYQVVDGVTYDVIFTVSERNCTKQAIDTKNKSATGRQPRGCRIVDNGQYGRCYFKLYHKSWTGELQIGDSTCVQTDLKDATS